MPNLSAEFWIMMVTYAASFGVWGGQTMVRLKSLEKKMDKHNDLGERTAIVERDLKTAFMRLDEIREEIKEHHPIKS